MEHNQQSRGTKNINTNESLSFQLRSKHSGSRMPNLSLFCLACPNLLLHFLLCAGNCGSANGPQVATCCGSSQWSSVRKRSNKAETTTTAHETWRTRCEDDYFARHKWCLLTCSLKSLSHTRKITCGEVRRVRGIGVVFTTSVDYKGIATACKRNTLQLGLFFEN